MLLNIFFQKEHIMKIAVVDGQGGGIGKSIVEQVKLKFGDTHEIIALGTNSLATSSMLKSGAHKGATGENAIVYTSPMADIIMGVVGIIAADSMMGELTSKMANAIASSDARKILIPLDKCMLEIVGVDKTLPIQSLIREACEKIDKSYRQVEIR